MAHDPSSIAPLEHPLAFLLHQGFKDHIEVASAPLGKCLKQQKQRNLNMQKKDIIKEDSYSWS